MFDKINLAACVFSLGALAQPLQAFASEQFLESKSPCPASREHTSKVPTENALSLYDQVVRIVTTKFYDQTFRGLPWPRMVQTYRGCLTRTSSLDETKQTINALLGNLNASHTEFVTSADQEYHGLASIFSRSLTGDRLYQIGAWFEQADGRWFVSSVFDDSPAAKAGLLRGDEIVSADRKRFSPVDSLNKKRVVVLTIRRKRGGEVSNLKIQPKFESVQESLLRATQASKKVIRVHGKRVAYFHLWSGTDDHFLEEIQKAAKEMESQSDVFVLDLRDGFGGAYGDYIAPFLSTDPETQKPINQIYTKPLIVLINEGVRSGKEGVANTVKASKRGKLVGTPTAGHYLAGRFFEIIPHAAALYLAVQKAPNAPELEGKGVAPDVEVTAPLNYSAGYDPQLEAALALIQ